MDREELLGDVAQGEVGDDPLVRPDIEQRDQPVGGPGEVVVAQHHTLGWAGGSRGVDEGGQILGAEGIQPLGEGGVVHLVAFGDEIAPAHHHRVVVVRYAVHRHDPAQAGETVTDPQDLVELRLVLHQDHRCLDMIRDVMHLGR